MLNEEKHFKNIKDKLNQIKKKLDEDPEDKDLKKEYLSLKSYLDRMSDLRS